MAWSHHLETLLAHDLVIDTDRKQMPDRKLPYQLLGAETSFRLLQFTLADVIRRLDRDGVAHDLQLARNSREFRRNQAVGTETGPHNRLGITRKAVRIAGIRNRARITAGGGEGKVDFGLDSSYER